jgi:hypothetical protein
MHSPSAARVSRSVCGEYFAPGIARRGAWNAIPGWGNPIPRWGNTVLDARSEEFDEGKALRRSGIRCVEAKAASVSARSAFLVAWMLAATWGRRVRGASHAAMSLES